MSRAEIVRRAGGWFVTGEEWSGPWASEEAAELARDGEYVLAHMVHRTASKDTVSLENKGGDYGE